MNTSLKTCFKCGNELPLSAFYVHPRMGDGRLGKCKECCKSYARESRNQPDTAARLSQYERARYKRPARKALMAQLNHHWRERNPIKRAAHIAVGNALRGGRLHRMPCEKCGSAKSEGHHPDYGKPLEVRWLCRKHHMELHRKD